MPSRHKPKLFPRHDLKGKIRSAGLTFTQFAALHSFERPTVYAVLDGYRTSGPVAREIIGRIERLRPARIAS